jgi:hypothetical protein
MGEVRATLGYRLSQNIRLSEAVKEKVIVWSVVACSTGGVLAGLLIGTLLYRWEPAVRARPENSSHLIGLGGWLVFVAIAIVVRPLIQLKSFSAMVGLMGDSTAWITLTDADSFSYKAGYAWLVWSEAFMQGLVFAWSLMMIPQFFRRKPSLPRSFSALIITSLIFEIVDHIALARVKITGIPPGTIVGHGVATVAWVWYFQVSRRVRATFRRSSRTSKPLPLQSPVEDALR